MFCGIVGGVVFSLYITQANLLVEPIWHIWNKLRQGLPENSPGDTRSPQFILQSIRVDCAAVGVFQDVY